MRKRENREGLLKYAENPGNSLRSEMLPDFLTNMSEGTAQSSIFDDFATPSLNMVPMQFYLQIGGLVIFLLLPS